MSNSAIRPLTPDARNRAAAHPVPVRDVDCRWADDHAEDHLTDDAGQVQTLEGLGADLAGDEDEQEIGKEPAEPAPASIAANVTAGR